jgi:ATP-dependent helicase HrpA
VRADLVPEVEQVLGVVETVLTASYAVAGRIEAERRPALAPSVEDLRAQLAALVPDRFASVHGKKRLVELPRYLQAMEVRLDKLAQDPARDRRAMADVARVSADLADLRRRVPPSPELTELRWMVEELRISVFAQPMRTRYPVSPQRIWKAMDALVG